MSASALALSALTKVDLALLVSILRDAWTKSILLKGCS